MRNYRHYDLTMKKKKWKKYVTRNRKTRFCIYGKNTKQRAYTKASLGLFLNFGQNRGLYPYEIVLLKKECAGLKVIPFSTVTTENGQLSSIEF